MPSPLRYLALTEAQVEAITWALPALLDSMKTDTQYWEDNPMWPEEEKTQLKRTVSRMIPKVERAYKGFHDLPDSARRRIKVKPAHTTVEECI